MEETINFPTWEPSKKSIEKFRPSLNPKSAFKAFRQSCSSFIKKDDVREFIMDRDLRKCKICESTLNLQIDHIVSVYHCFRNELLYFCNTVDNLQVLCSKCNASKKP